MLTLEQAKEIQRKRSKACLLKFGGYVLLAVALWGVLFFFTDYLAKHGALYVVFPLLLLVGAKMSKLLAFLQKNEFIGKIVDGDIKMVTARRYGATNQPGTTYAASDMPILEITVENDILTHYDFCIEIEGEGSYSGQKIVLEMTITSDCVFFDEATAE